MYAVLSNTSDGDRDYFEVDSNLWFQVFDGEEHSYEAWANRLWNVMSKAQIAHQLCGRKTALSKTSAIIRLTDRSGALSAADRSEMH